MRPPFAAQGQHDGSGDDHNRDRGAKLQDPQDRQGVAARRRVVMEAQQQDRQCARGNAVGRPRDAQPDVAGLVAETEQIAGDGAGAGQEDQAGGVKELFVCRIEARPEADRVGDRPDRLLRTRSDSASPMTGSKRAASACWAERASAGVSDGSIDSTTRL